MTVLDVINVLSKFPDDEEISVLYPDDNYGDDVGVTIGEIAYITGTKNVKNGVYIKLG